MSNQCGNRMLTAESDAVSAEMQPAEQAALRLAMLVGIHHNGLFAFTNI